MRNASKITARSTRSLALATTVAEYGAYRAVKDEHARILAYVDARGWGEKYRVTLADRRPIDVHKAGSIQRARAILAAWNVSA